MKNKITRYEKNRLAHMFFGRESSSYKDLRSKYFLTHPIDTIFYFIKRIKWFFQRGVRGWGDCDIWDMDIYLAHLISEITKNLGEKTFNNKRKKDLQPEDVILYNALKNIEKGFEVYKAFSTKNGCVAKMQKETEEALNYFVEYFTSLRLKMGEQKKNG